MKRLLALLSWLQDGEWRTEWCLPSGIGYATVGKAKNLGLIDELTTGRGTTSSYRITDKGLSMLNEHKEER